MKALQEIAALVQRETGIRLTESQHPALQAALDRITPQTDPTQFMRRALDPLAGRELVARLIDEVTVKETSFLRDHGQLQEIRWRLLLEEARASGAETVRVWSAGCATGEEAYSLALLATEAFAPLEPPVTILATDVSGDALSRARAGEYRPRSVRDLDQVLRSRYFQKQGDHLVVGERLRTLVTFARHNLVHDPVPPLGEAPFHLILCRNVLIYFDGETVERVIASLEQALDPAGMLLLGAADALCGSAGRLRALVAGTPPPAPPPGRRRPRSRRDSPDRTPSRPPTPSRPSAAPGDGLAALVVAAGASHPHEVIAHVSRLLKSDPLNEVAYFLRGLAELEDGDAGAAVGSLRRALYVEPRFGLAAFKLGRAHEALTNRAAARRAYEQALRTLEHEDERYEILFGQVDPADVAAAARTRLEALAAIGIAGGTRPRAA